MSNVDVDVDVQLAMRPDFGCDFHNMLSCFESFGISFLYSSRRRSKSFDFYRYFISGVEIVTEESLLYTISEAVDHEITFDDL